MNGRILILDDDPIMRSWVSTTLGQEFYECLEAASESEALEILRSRPIDLLTQDIQRITAGDVGGVEFVRLLKSDSHLRHIPVLVISAESEEDAKCLFERAGVEFGKNVAGYLQKPNSFSRQNLVRVVEAILSKENELELTPPTLAYAGVSIETKEELEKILPLWRKASDAEMRRRMKEGLLAGQKPDFIRAILSESLSVEELAKLRGDGWSL